MTALQKETIAYIQNVSDEKLYFILQIIKGVHGLEQTETAEKRDRAFAVYESLRRPGPEIDYERELAEYREAKYGAHGID